MLLVHRAADGRMSGRCFAPGLGQDVRPKRERLHDIRSPRCPQYWSDHPLPKEPRAPSCKAPGLLSLFRALRAPRGTASNIFASKIIRVELLEERAQYEFRGLRFGKILFARKELKRGGNFRPQLKAESYTLVRRLHG